MNEPTVTSARRSAFLVRVAQLVGAATTIVAVVALAAPTSGCQCAALCGSAVFAVVQKPANATNKDPEATFELCDEQQCRSFKIVGTACLLASGGASICEMSSDGLQIRIAVAAEDGDDVKLTVKSSAGAVLFEKEAEVDAEEVETCGTTCYEGDVKFTIPQ